jgi:hypothetical protein
MIAGALILLLPLTFPVAPGPPARTAPDAPIPAAAGQATFGTPNRPLSIGVGGLVYIERSEPELDGETNGFLLGFTAQVHRRASILVEAGRAKFYGDDQPGHRDYFLSGLLGVHPMNRDGGPVLVGGVTLIHSERHKFFGDLSTNRAGLTVGADWAWPIGEQIIVAANWRTDLAGGMTVHRPGASLRFRF